MIALPKMQEGPKCLVSLSNMFFSAAFCGDSFGGYSTFISGAACSPNSMEFGSIVERSAPAEAKAQVLYSQHRADSASLLIEVCCLVKLHQVPGLSRFGLSQKFYKSCAKHAKQSHLIAFNRIQPHSIATC